MDGGNALSPSDTCVVRQLRLSHTLVLLLLVACTGQTTPGPPSGMEPSSPVVEPAQIIEIRIEPKPEGPIPRPFQRNPGEYALPLSEILAYVPLPLPAEIPQSCTGGGTLTITLSSGRQIAYGPCKRPIEIDRLWWHILDVLSEGRCRPNCWPGGMGPAGESIPPAVSSN
jgi:hypothetical protein